MLVTVPAIHERDVEELDLPGRRLRWLVSPHTLPANNCSACVITVPPGEKVRPAQGGGEKTGKGGAPQHPPFFKPPQACGPQPSTQSGNSGAHRTSSSTTS